MPTPVTLRVKNTSRDVLLLRDGKGQHGLTVQRKVGSDWFGFDDQPCSCQTCDLICDRSCRCPDAGITEFVLAVPPNGQADRTWDGVVQVAGFNCGQTCVMPENAPTDETFRLELCFVNQIDGVDAPADGGRVLGAFPPPNLQTCVTREFQPQQGVVEISPARGADCSKNADCKGSQELCLGGSCTAGCPSNTYPALAELGVGFHSMGFFAESRDLDGGRTLQTGTGRITATQFSGETMQVSLTNAGGTGRFEVKLPGGLGGPSLPTTVDLKVLVVVRGSGNRIYRAVTVRDARSDELIFAADSAIDGTLLTSVELSPFSVATEGEPVGCRVESTCGKMLFSRQVLSASQGTTGSVSAEPGKLVTGSFTTAGTPVAYRFWNVTAGQYGSDTCRSYRPYTFWKL